MVRKIQFAVLATIFAIMIAQFSQSSSTVKIEQYTVYFYGFAIERITGIPESQIQKIGCEYTIQKLQLERTISEKKQSKISNYDPQDVRAMVKAGSIDIYIDVNGNVLIDNLNYLINKDSFTLALQGQIGDCWYNWKRYYDLQTGRYITSDLIGLNGGLNIYGYAEQNLPRLWLQTNNIKAWVEWDFAAGKASIHYVHSVHPGEAVMIDVTFLNSLGSAISTLVWQSKPLIDKVAIKSTFTALTMRIAPAFAALVIAHLFVGYLFILMGVKVD